MQYVSLSLWKQAGEPFSYLTERLPHVIWLDTEKLQERVELKNPIHHRSSGETPSIGRSQAMTGLGGFGIPVLDTLGFVEDDAVKNGFCWMKQREFGTFFLIEIYVVMLVVLDKLLTSLEFLRQSAVGGDYDIILKEFFNRRLSAMIQKHRQLMRCFCLGFDLLLPLP